MRRLLIVPVLMLGIALAACSSGNGTTSASSTTTTAAASSTSTTAASSTTTTTTTATSSKVPAVKEPTNLSSEPDISAGTPPPPTTLVTKDLVVGTGATATATSKVSVMYIGANYTTGDDFTTSTWKTGTPTSFALTTVVPGFAQGITGMKVGGRREIVIPPSLGYGAKGSPPAVGPTETLVFVVDLKSVS